MKFAEQRISGVTMIEVATGSYSFCLNGHNSKSSADYTQPVRSWKSPCSFFFKLMFFFFSSIKADLSWIQNSIIETPNVLLTPEICFGSTVASFFFQPSEFEFDFQSKKSELKSLLNQNGCKWTGQSD